MDANLKDCKTCKHHKGYSIDDVSNECYPCVYHEKKLGYYPSWEPKVGEEVQILPKDFARDYMNILNSCMDQDNVNHPDHYKTGGIETIDYIKAKLGTDGTINYCMGNVMKYTSRWQSKNGLEDLKKAQWYLAYAINILEDIDE